MKPAYAVLWLATLALAFAAGRQLAPASSAPDVATIESFRDALEERDWLVRAYGISAFLRNLSPDNIDAAVEVVEAKRRWLSQDELRLFMIAWVRFDPAAAFARALSWPDHTRTKASSAAIYAWTLRDPAAARQALVPIQEIALRERLLDRMLAAWARKGDTAGVTGYVAVMPSGKSRDRFTTVIVHQLLEEGPEALIEWAEAIPADSADGFKQSAIRTASGVLAQEDPVRAAAWIAAEVNRPYAVEAARTVAREWVVAEPRAALEWGMGLPQEAGQAEAISAGFNRWLRQSPTEAEEWLLEAEPAQSLDLAHVILVRRSLATSPESALDVAERIQDESLREQNQIAVARSWMRRDPEAAAAWLAESGLSEAARSQIGQPRPRRQRTRTPGRPPAAEAPAGS